MEMSVLHRPLTLGYHLDFLKGIYEYRFVFVEDSFRARCLSLSPEGQMYLCSLKRC